MIAQRVAWYNEAHPKRPALSASNGWATGTWCIGACYKNPNPLYGAYPHGYLDRVHSMFPDAERVLHVFSGGLTLEHADAALAKGQRKLRKSASDCPYRIIELVDLKGPEDGRHPTWQGDILKMPAAWGGRFDLILADPPYSTADAEVYGVPMPKITAVMSELRRVAKPGANLVWLDQKWPMHKKTEWRTWAHIGLVRSTNHRTRLVTMMEAV